MSTRTARTGPGPRPSAALTRQRELGVLGEERGQLRRLHDAAGRRLDRLHRRRARRAVERKLADVFAGPVLREDDVAPLRRARIGAQLPGQDDVERATGVALVE